MSKKKKITFLMRKAPHGTIYTHEGLEALLIFCTYEQAITLVLMDDGVYVLKKGQDTMELGTKAFSSAFRVLEDYGVERIIVDKTALTERGLTVEDLMIDVEVLESAEIMAFMKKQEVILPF
ncbi:MAG: sulfurtransferase complex subunit TusC [Deltaproteobacteria bacterium]|nr:sulfurtransferase complex subunit TusC [Deltaproteobacteria bacterium]